MRHTTACGHAAAAAGSADSRIAGRSADTACTTTGTGAAAAAANRRRHDFDVVDVGGQHAVRRSARTAAACTATTTGTAATTTGAIAGNGHAFAPFDSCSPATAVPGSARRCAGSPIAATSSCHEGLDDHDPIDTHGPDADRTAPATAGAAATAPERSRSSATTGTTRRQTHTGAGCATSATATTST